MTPAIHDPNNTTRSHNFLSVRSEFWFGLALVISTLLVYWQVKDFSYINYDSPEYVFDNYRVQSGLSLSNIQWAFTTTYFSNWHPLTWLSHMLDVELYGLNPGHHHITNVIFHIINTLLLLYFLNKTIGQVLPSAFVAGLFALHPLHVQSVAWIAERKDLLCCLFFLLTLISYVAYQSKPSWSRYCLVLLLFGLGLMAKPMIVTLPCVLLLLDFWPLKRIFFNKAVSKENSQNPSTEIHGVVRLLVEKIPFFFLSFVSCLLTFYAQKLSGAVASVTELAVPDRIGNALVSYLLYIFKTAWPVNLAIIYPHPGTQPGWLILLAAVCFVLLSCICLSRPLRAPYLLLGWLWFIGTLVPVIGIIQVGIQALADRYTYIPLIGLFIIFSWSLYLCIPKQWNRSLCFSSIATSILLVLSVVSWNQLQYWQNSTSLFTRAIEITENNYVAHNNLGYQFIQNNQFKEAQIQFEKSLQIEPNFEIAQLNLGRSLVHEGKIESGINHYIEALKIKPDYADAHNNLGNALLKINRTREAAHHYLQAIRYNDSLFNAYNNLGALLILDGKYDAAIDILQKAVDLNPKSLETQVNLDTAVEAKKEQSNNQ